MWATYVFRSTATPRSGVDWIAQSRFLSPWIAFPIVIGDFFYLIYWDVWAYWFATFLGMQPFFTLSGLAFNNAALAGLANWIVTPPGYFTIGLILMLFMGWQLAAPIMLFAKIQRYLMLFATIALVIFVVAYLSMGNQLFISNFNQFASRFVADPDYYHTVLKKAAEAGYNANPGFNWYDQIGQMALIWSLLGWAFFLYDNLFAPRRLWSATRTFRRYQPEPFSLSQQLGSHVLTEVENFNPAAEKRARTIFFPIT